MSPESYLTFIFLFRMYFSFDQLSTMTGTTRVKVNMGVLKNLAETGHC